MLINNVLTNEKSIIIIEPDNYMYNASVKKNDETCAAAWHYRLWKPQSVWKSLPFSVTSMFCFCFCHYLCTPGSPWAHPFPVHPVIPCQPLHTSRVFNSRVRDWQPPFMISNERYLTAHKSLFCCLIHVSISFYNSII